MKSFIVLGSLNIDLNVHTSRFVRAGETISGEFDTAYGGKGANQAVAIARLGGQVEMIGLVGDDPWGDSYRSNLQREGVMTGSIGTVKNCPTGTASIEIETSGQNRIVISAGANARLDGAAIDACFSRMESLQQSFCLAQLEVPLPTNLYGLEQARRRGMRVMLDPAPATELPDHIWPLIDYITPNETECRMLTGVSCVKDDDNARQAAERLLRRGCRQVIIKAGRHGVFYADSATFFHAPTFNEVPTINTVAAGDCFNGALAFALTRGDDMRQAVRFANAAASLSTTRSGAQSSLPTLNEVERFLGL